MSAAAIIIIAESDNLCEQRRRLTATEEEVTWRRGGFGKLPLRVLPPRGLLVVNQRKWELHVLKRVNVSNHCSGSPLEDSSGPAAFRDTCFEERHLV